MSADASASPPGPPSPPATAVPGSARTRRIALLLVALLVGFVLMRTCFRERSTEVDVASAEIGPVEDVVVNSEAGTVKARSRARLGVEAHGRVAGIPHRENDHVKRGALLLSLDPATERTRLEAARRDRVIGIMESKGQYLGFDMDDTAYIPLASAMRLLNRSEVGEVDLLAASTDDVDAVVERATRLMIDRHRGEEDVTIVTQKDALQMVDQIMRVITLTVTAIAGISLLVGAIGILTILMIVVRERVREIGLVKALGATRNQILAWYLCEAAVTAGIGSVAGLAAGVGGAAALSRVVPGITTTTPLWIAVSAMAMSVTVGLLAGVAPALRAAGLDPVEALRSE